MIREYRTIIEIADPLITVSDVEGMTYKELAEIELPGGEIRKGQVIEATENYVTIQLFGSTAGISLSGSKVRFPGHPLQLGVSDDISGRVFSGLGSPIDGGPDILAEKYLDISGLPLNPTSRTRLNDAIHTGISAVDGLCPLICGQKLSILSGGGLPHIQLAAQIACQAKILGVSESDFAIVFAGVGITFVESEYIIQEFRRTGVITRTTLFLTYATASASERLATPRMALTAAEYLAFDKDMHVLVILTDMTNYADALREVSVIRKKAPGRRGYPGNLSADFASMFERGGKRSDKNGSITLIPIVTVPEDDITHPVPDAAVCTTDGQLVFSRSLFQNGIVPPVDVSISGSRLKERCVANNKIREDYADVSNQLLASYCASKEVLERLAILGENALSPTDLLYVRFAEEFERRYISQDFDENRSINDTLTIGWELLSILPDEELKHISPEYIGKYSPEKK